MLDKSDRTALANGATITLLACVGLSLLALGIGAALHLCLSLANWGVLWA